MSPFESDSRGDEELTERVVPFRAGDGRALNLINVRGKSNPDRGPVLLVHGAGVRANLFRPPVKPNLVEVLIEQGYDVWLENWRASIDLEPCHWTLDEAAAWDHPQAVRKVVEETGHEKIKAIIHCQGSTSFMMSAVAGLVPQVETIVSNAVSLHPVVPKWSGFKLRFVVPAVAPIMPMIDPHWGVNAPGLVPKVTRALVRLAHRECRNDVCRLVSFTYGSGFPALWRHENLTEETHEWLKEEFGPVTLRFFRQMARCVRQGHLVSLKPTETLPDDYVASPPKMHARISFLAGEQSGCFLPESQQRSYEYFSQFRPDHTLHMFPGYSHLDVLIGKNAFRDVFPVILKELSG